MSIDIRISQSSSSTLPVCMCICVEPCSKNIHSSFGMWQDGEGKEHSSVQHFRTEEQAADDTMQ